MGIVVCLAEPNCVEDLRTVNIHVGTSAGRDATGGDHTETGDVAGQGIAIGRGSSANVATYMGDILADILRRLIELERKVMELDIRYNSKDEREQRDRSNTSGTTTAIIGAMIFLAITTLMLYLALGGINATGR